MAKDLSELKYKTTPEQRAASWVWAKEASEKLRAHDLRKEQRAARKILKAATDDSTAGTTFKKSESASHNDEAGRVRTSADSKAA